MICRNCNTENNNESKFCIRCGASLLNNEVVQPQPSVAQPQVAPVQQTVVQPQVAPAQQPVAQPQVAPVQQTVAQPQMAQTAAVSVSQPANIGTSLLGYIMYVIAVLMKPFKAYKEEEHKFADAKSTLIFGGVVAVVMTVIELIKAMIAGIFVEKFDYSTFKTKTEIDFSNLKNLDYVQLIFKNLLIYAGVIVAIALVYYLVAFIFKKSLNFIKLISISATSILPYVVLGMIVSPILGKIWAPLSIFSMIVGAIYSIVILVNLMNEEVELENTDFKIYYHAICLSVLVSALCYLVYQIVLGSITSGLGGMLNLLG